MGRVVVVLGGNAFVAPGQRLSIEGQIQFAYQSMAALAPLLNDDTELLISHGNGPQVGQILTRVEAALGKAYPLPLEVCVAESQGDYAAARKLYSLLAAKYEKMTDYEAHMSRREVVGGKEMPTEEVLFQFRNALAGYG